MQRLWLGQATEVMCAAPATGMGEDCHAVGELVGSLVTETIPPGSPARQKVLVGQLTPPLKLAPGAAAAVQAGSSVDSVWRVFPPWSTAIHVPVRGHATPVTVGVQPISEAVCQGPLLE